MLRLFLMLAVGLLTSCESRQNETKIVRPCGTAATSSVPITTECMAAAVAEGAFLEETHHKYKTYLITTVAVEHTPSTWEFMIVLGDKDNPPPPGGHFLVRVDKATGKTEVTPGA